jgi:hypothetical protein
METKPNSRWMAQPKSLTHDRLIFAIVSQQRKNGVSTTTRQQFIFFGAFIFLGIDQYNCNIFLDTGTE